MTDPDQIWSPWPPGPHGVGLDRDQVDVWIAKLDLDQRVLHSLWHALTPCERRRAERFVRRVDGDRFIAARGSLRAILASYLDVQPCTLRFGRGPRGKPYLTAPEEDPGLRFNVSHSRGLALYAVARQREVGVDIERVREVETERIVRRFFSPAEAAAFMALPAEAKTEAFFHCWTCKEAYIKATGEGVSRPLDQFAVSVNPQRPAALQQTRGDPDEAARWSLRRLSVPPGYAAALAVQGQGWHLRCWRWRE